MGLKLIFSLLNENSKFVVIADKSDFVKKTSGASERISSNCWPSSRKISISSPSILYSMLAKTGGPESNLSVITFKSGLFLASSLPRLGILSIIAV